jgi:hypothetical protein
MDEIFFQVMAIHRLSQVNVGVGIKALGQLIGLMI